MPPGVGVSGLESDRGDRFYCWGGKSGRGASRPPTQASLREKQLRARRLQALIARGSDGVHLPFMSGSRGWLDPRTRALGGRPTREGT
jgi:hypothetical protein